MKKRVEVRSQAEMKARGCCGPVVECDKSGKPLEPSEAVK